MQLTKDFNLSEFQSKDGAEMPQSVLENIIVLANNLQVIRDYINDPIHINSAYRSPSHNKRIGGAKNSYHVKGMAADLTTKSYTPKQLSKIILNLIHEGKILQGGVGLYNGFVHYDIRGFKARWNESSKYNF